MVFVRFLGGFDQVVAVGVAVIAALLHQFFQRHGIGFVHQLPLGGAGEGDDALPIGHGGDAPGVGADGITHLGGKILQIPHGRILAEDHTAVFFRVNFQRVALSYNIDIVDLVQMLGYFLDYADF